MKSIFPVFRGTSPSLKLLQPFLADRGPSIPGVPVGTLMSGAPFTMNEFEAERLGYITGVGTVVSGYVGSRKSTYVKCDIMRKKFVMRGERRWRTLVFDYKGEYGGVARFYGTELINFADPDVAARYVLNILDLELLTKPQRLALVESLALAVSGVIMTDLEREALISALARTDADGVATLPRLEERLRNPTHADARGLGLNSKQELFDQGHRLAAVINSAREMIPGFFEGTTSEALKLDQDFTAYSFRGLPEMSKRVMVAIIGGFVEAVLDNDSDRFQVDTIVYEEVWEYFRFLGFGRFARKSQKLHRQAGHHNVFVIHRVSDLDAAGNQGSEAVALAKGLIADCAIKVIYPTKHGEVKGIGDLLDLNDTQRWLIEDNKPGTALWVFGKEVLVSTHRPTAYELPFTYTNENMHRDPKSGLLLPESGLIAA